MDKTIIKIIPIINPDGVIFGNFRTNYLGIDLNRGFFFAANTFQFLLFQALQRCRFCQTLMQEILEARQLSHYLLADFQLKQSSDLITCKVVGEAEIEELALGQTYEIIAKAIDGNLNYYQCIHMEPFNHGNKSFGLFCSLKS